MAAHFARVFLAVSMDFAPLAEQLNSPSLRGGSKDANASCLRSPPAIEARALRSYFATYGGWVDVSTLEDGCMGPPREGGSRNVASARESHKAKAILLCFRCACVRVCVCVCVCAYTLWVYAWLRHVVSSYVWRSMYVARSTGKGCVQACFVDEDVGCTSRGWDVRRPKCSRCLARSREE